MLSKLTICLVLVSAFHLGSGENKNSTKVEDTKDRNGKVFSLFSIVSFKNVGCRSSSSMTTGQSTARNGTCFTSSECSSKGGTASGNCAAGFGVCCIFLVSASSSTIDQNCTYIRNPGFPNALTTTTQLTYTIKKCSPEICYLRLDFEQFQTLGPNGADEAVTAGGSCAEDSLVFTATSGARIPTICGLNTGQHIYVDLGNAPTDSLNMAFSFLGASTNRIFEIKVSQIECNNLNRPPDGCEQYWTGLTGRITTFNFFDTTNRQAHLAKQDVTACIRRAAGFCCIQYQACPDQADSFSLDSSTTLLGPDAVGQVDSECSNDYVGIPGGSTSCRGTRFFNKFCSFVLDPFRSGGSVNVPICDCTQPFSVHFHTDDLTDLTILPGEVVVAISRGVCLDFTQIPC